MGKEAWQAYWFQKQNIKRPSVEDCIEELKILQSDVQRASNRAGYEDAVVLQYIRYHFPEYDASCNLSETTNHFSQYADHLLRHRMQIISSLINRLHIVEVYPGYYQHHPLDHLKISAPAQAFHLLLLQVIRKNIETLLRERHRV